MLLAKPEIALIGIGLIARIHLDAWVKASACVRVYATDDRAAILARDFGATAVGSLAEALDGVTAVDICTPTGSHREIALAAIAAGAGVVCEKPLASNSAEAEGVVNAAEKAGLPLYPAHNTRFVPAYARLRQIVASRHLGRGAIGRFTSTAYHPRPWTEHAPERTGGILTDQMLHGVDIAYWIFGEVTRVHAWYQGNIADPAPLGTVATGTAVLTHARDAISQVVSSWAPPPTPVRGTFHVTGTTGTVSYDSQSHLGLRVIAGTAAGLPRYFGESPFLTEIREFAEALAGGPEPRVGAGIAVLSFAHARAAAYAALLCARPDVELVIADHPARGELTMTFVGGKASVEFDAFPRLLDGFDSLAVRERWEGSDADLDATMLGESISGVQSGRHPGPDGAAALRTVRIVLAAYRSLQTGQPVALWEHAAL